MNSVLCRHKYNGFSLKQAYLLQLFHFILVSAWNLRHSSTIGWYKSTTSF